MQTLWFGNFFNEWGFWFVRLIKLAEYILLKSPYSLLAIHLAGFSVKNKEIETDEQPLLSVRGASNLSDNSKYVNEYKLLVPFLNNYYD